MAIIHVNRQNIAMNAKDNKNRPVYTTKIKGKTIYSREVIINGPSKCIYSNTPLRCGAKAWIEADDDLVQFIDPMTFKESRNV